MQYIVRSITFVYRVNSLGKNEVGSELANAFVSQQDGVWWLATVKPRLTDEELERRRISTQAGKSSETYIIMTIDDFANCLNDNSQIDSIFLDFSKAFWQ